MLQPSGRTYHFPFRLDLRPIRTLDEPLVRAEFAYVAENLLLRGGYRKTHFQADQTTLQNVSEMGVPAAGSPEPLVIVDADTFIPRVVRNRGAAAPPYVFPLRELILQTMVRRHLSVAANLDRFLKHIGVTGLDAAKLEVLGEKAFPEGHVDVLIKEATPIGMGRKVVVEVKLRAATGADVQQLRLYMDRLGKECAGGILVAREFGARLRNQAAQKQIACVRHILGELGDEPVAYERFLERFRLAPSDG